MSILFSHPPTRWSIESFGDTAVTVPGSRHSLKLAYRLSELKQRV